MSYVNPSLWKNRKGVTKGAIFGHPTSQSWWTEARKEKLRYVMEKYDDLDKAARVLGQPRHAVARVWCWMKRQDKLNDR